MDDIDLQEISPDQTHDPAHKGLNLVEQLDMGNHVKPGGSASGQGVFMSFQSHPEGVALGFFLALGESTSLSSWREAESSVGWGMQQAKDLGHCLPLVSGSRTIAV